MEENDVGCKENCCLCTLDAEQATESIQQLSSTLEQLSHDREEGKGFRGTEDSLVVEEDDKKTQSEAGNSD